MKALSFNWEFPGAFFRLAAAVRSTSSTKSRFVLLWRRRLALASGKITGSSHLKCRPRCCERDNLRTGTSNSDWRANTERDFHLNKDNRTRTHNRECDYGSCLAFVYVTSDAYAHLARRKYDNMTVTLELISIRCKHYLLHYL